MKSSSLVAFIFWILAGITLTTGLVNEFHAGHDGWCAARRAVAARNALDEGFLNTRGGMVLNIGDFSDEEYKPYWHHPQGIHWLTTAAFWMFGEGVWQARLGPTLLMLVNLFLLMRLGRRWFPKSPTWQTGVLFLSVPMLSFYGPFVAHQPLMLTGALITLSLWNRVDEKGKEDSIWLTGLVATLGAFTAWPWFLFAFFIGLPVLMQYRSLSSRQRKWLLMFSVGTILGAALVLMHAAWQSGASWDDVEKLFSRRSTGKGVSTGSLVAKMQGPWSQLFNPYLCTLSGIYLLRLGFRMKNGKPSPEAPSALAFLATGLLWTFLFKQGASVHEYWPWYTAPFFVIASTALFDDVRHLLGSSRPSLRYSAIALPMLVIVATGIGTTYGRHLHPSPSHPEWSDGYFRDKIEGWKWIREHSEKSESIALARNMIPGAGRAQYRYYGNRKYRVLNHKELLTTPILKSGENIVAVDLGELSATRGQEILLHWKKRLDLIFLDTILIGKRPEADSPRLQVFHGDTSARPWLSPTSPSLHWRPSELLRRNKLLQAGFLTEALDEPDFIERTTFSEAHSLLEKVTLYNLKLHAGLSPLPPKDWLGVRESHPATKDVSFGDELTLLWGRADYQWQFAVRLTALLQVERELSRNWRPTLKGLRTYTEKEKKEKKDRGFPYYGDSVHWIPGQLILLERFAPLPNRSSLAGVEYQFALWSGGDREKKQKSRFLRLTGGDHYLTVHPEPGSTWALLKWLGMNWMRDNDE